MNKFKFQYFTTAFKNYYLLFNCLYVWFMVFNATFSNISAISGRPVLVVEEAGVSGENHRPNTSYGTITVGYFD
jgi:hypothetical protein